MDQLHFKTHVLLKSIIGKDLINDDNIAILELVKNSYDAGSPKVDVIFKNLTQNDDKENHYYSQCSSKIILKDSGKGMSKIDIEDKWLNIAYSEKKSKKEEGNRVLAGNKGVGRFSCDRLGQYLDLYTRTRNDSSFFHLKINWNDFEIEGRSDLSEAEKKEIEIQQINVYLEEISESDFEIETGYSRFDSGVILEISKLRSQWAFQDTKRNKPIWSVDKLVKLRGYLEKLINPNQAFQKKSFSIELSVDEFPEVSGFIENKVFDKLEFTSTSIESLIDSTGKKIYTTLYDKGRTIFVLEEQNTSFPLLKDIRIILYYLNTYSKIYFAKQTGIRSVNFGSIFLFINGFLIPPYGEEGNDWLGLETRKGQGKNRYLSTRELVGRIEINDTSNNFKVISSREGVVNDDYFLQLTESGDFKKNRQEGYFYYTLRRLEKYVVDGLKWDKVTGEEDLDQDESLSKKRAKIIKDFEVATSSITPLEAKKFETYYESDYEKNKRIFHLIRSIIDVKKENIIDLYINEDLLEELIINEEKETQRKIEALLNESQFLGSADIEERIKIINTNREALKETYDKIFEVSSSVTNPKTLSTISSAKDMYNSFETAYSAFIDTIGAITKEKRLAEDLAAKEAEEKKRLELELESERQLSKYLLATRRTLSEDADGLIHTIKITSIDIRDAIDNLISLVTSKDYSEKTLLKKLGNIRFNAEKALKMSEIATRSNFKEDIEKRSVDIVQFVVEYLNIYNESYSTRISFEINSNNSRLVKIISVLNLSIILDNLISNSIKWGAHTIRFDFENLNETTLVIKVSDDGHGLSDKFLQNPERIFELAVGDTPPTVSGGSGIGLFYTRQLLKEMYGDICFLGNGVILNGATFQITLTRPN